MDVFTLETSKNKNNMFILLGEILEKLGYVNNGYSKALIEREEKWPTGLSFPDSFNIAIPHADIEYSRKEALIIIKNNKEPFIFHNMEKPQEKLNVSIVLNIVLTNPHRYVSFLSDIVKFLGKESTREKLANNSLSEIQQLLINSFPKYSLVAKGSLLELSIC